MNIEKYTVLIPILKYDKINDNLLFVLKDPVKLIINGKKEYLKELPISDINFHGNYSNEDYSVSYEIIKENLENGLKIDLIQNSKFNRYKNMHKSDFKKIAYEITALFVNLRHLIQENNDYYDYSDNTISYSNEEYDEELYDDIDDENNSDIISSYDKDETLF